MNSVAGELTTRATHASALRLHVFLSDKANAAPERVKGGKVKLPCLKEDEHEDAPPQNTNPEETSQMTFSAMSFQRRSLTDSVEKFMAGLLNCYKDKGLDFTQADGTVWLGKEKHQWKDIVSRVPAYFLQILKDVQGWRFSSQVHNQLMQLLPKRRFA